MAENTTQEDLNQIITSYRQNLQLDKPDDELLRAIDKAIQESMQLKGVIDGIGKTNKQYWRKGTSEDLARIHPKKAKSVANRIFTDVETAIPILTSEPPEPTVIGNVSNDIQETIQKGLNIAYEVKYKMQQKLQMMIRHWFIFRIGILKYRWDEEKGFITENVLPRKVGFDKKATCKDNCEYVWEEMECKVEDLVDKFPKKKKEINQLVDIKANLKSKVRYIEFWGGKGEWVAWKWNNIILDKKKNPNWDYDNPEMNVFENPQSPYLFLNVFNLGDDTGMYDETSVIEEAIPMQDSANKLERQILDLNEGQKRVWVTTNVADNVVQDLIDSTGDLAVKTRQPNSVQQVQSGKPDASLFNHLAHLQAEIDNIIGIHSTTRGSLPQRQETLGAQQMQVGQDIGRLDLIVRNVEQVMEEWYNSYLHMIKVYATEAEFLNNGTNRIELTADMIPPKIQIMIKKGSTLPIDRRSKQQNAMTMAQVGMIDPATLFEELGFPNVPKRVQDLYQWLQMTGKIQPPQPQMSPTGQPSEIQGQMGGDQSVQQLQQISKIINSPEFQNMPEQNKLQSIQRIKKIVGVIKNL